MDLTKEQLDWLVKCRVSTKLFAKTFFPTKCFREFTPIHEKIFDVLDNDSIRKAVIIAPRGIGKTTLLSEIYPLKQALYRDAHYIISMSANAPSAIEQTENMKYEIKNNERLRAVFGDFSGRMGKEEWFIDFGDGDSVKVVPKGAGQSIRGRRYKQYRPDLILVDDLENDRNIKSEVQRGEKRNWFFASLQNIVDIYSDEWRIIVIGTLMHQDSLLQSLIDSPEWYSLVLPLADDNLKSNVPTWRDDKWIRDELANYESNGSVDQFYMEFMCTVISGSNALFQKQFFRSYNESSLSEEAIDMKTVIMVDPARGGVDPKSDTAVMAVGVRIGNAGVSDACLYVRDIIVGRLSPNEMYEAILDLADRYDAVLLAPETTGLNNFLIYPIKDAILTRYGYMKYRIYDDDKGVRPIRSKVDRARALVPLYKKGSVLHNESIRHLIEPHLLSYPRCKKWDALDCLSNVIDVMDKSDIFLQDYSGLDSDEEMKKEYDRLKREDELVGALPDTWKII